MIVFSIDCFGQSIEDSIRVETMLKTVVDFEQTNVDSALIYADEAYKLAHNGRTDYLTCKTALRLGIVYQNISNYKKATEYYKEGAKLAEKIGNKKLLAQAYNCFGNLFALQKQLSQASEYFNKALVISKEINDVRKVAVILSNLANIEYSKAYVSNDYTNCNLVYKEALEWAVLAKDTEMQISTVGNWGMSYSDEGKFDLSIEKLNYAINLAKESNHQSDLISLYHYLGRTQTFMKQYDKALASYGESLRLAFEFKDVDFQSENYFCLAELNYDIGKYKEAYDFFEKFKTTEDTLTNKAVINELNTIKIKYDTEKKQKEIELLKVNANKDKIMKISLLIGSLFLLALAFLLFNRYKLKSKTNLLLETQNAIITEKNKDISDSINYAKKIQDAILPNSNDIKKVFPNSFVLSMPKDVVSGDFYWFTENETYKIFVVADCTGHGVPGAFMSMIGTTLLNNIVNERKNYRPDIILNELRKSIITDLKQGEDSQNKDGMDVSLICINKETNVLQVACANNPIWIVKQDNLLIEIKADKQPIGYVSSNQKDFTLQSLELEKGDIVYQFTDGFADQFGGIKGKKFKYSQLKEIIIGLKSTSINEQGDVLKQVFTKWKDNVEQIDDVLISGIKI
jgi:serine phosphatase RsbU (regulator of sigma subunit)